MRYKIIFVLIAVGITYFSYSYFFYQHSLFGEQTIDIAIHNDIGYIKQKEPKVYRNNISAKNSVIGEIKLAPKKRLLNNRLFHKKINSFGNKIIDFSGFSNGGEVEGNLSLWLPIGDDVNADNIESSVIYISNWQNNQLISCNVNKTYYDPATSGGTNGSGVTPTSLYNCKTVDNLNLNSPENMVINNNTLYIVNFGSIKSFVSSCKLDNNGNVLNCFNLNLPINYATYINFNSSSQILVSAFPVKGFCNMASCQADNAGNITICSNGTTVASSLIPPLVVNNFQYKVDTNNNAIDRCVGGACQLITNPLFMGPIGLFVSQNTAYIANSNNTLIGCGVDQNSGWLFNCTTLASGLNSPAGITQFNINSN